MRKTTVPTSRDELNRLYWDEEESTTEIGKRFGATNDQVIHWLVVLGIPRRSKSDAIRLSHRKGRKKREITSKLRSELLCRQCGGVWKHEEKATITYCPYCGAKKCAIDARGEGANTASAKARKSSLIKWYADPVNRKARGKKSRDLLRKRVFFRITGTVDNKCARCGCDDVRLLEINHKNGGGGKETQKGNKVARFYLDIASGKRKTDDLELLCKPCNGIHALEMKYGQLPMKVVWG